MSLHLVYPAIADHLKASVSVDRIYVGDPPANVALPYVFVWGPLPVETHAPLALIDERLQVQVVAKATPEVNSLANRVVDALNDFVPTVPGHDCQPLQVTHTTAATSDQQVIEPGSGTRPAYLTVVCRFQANRKVNP